MKHVYRWYNTSWRVPPQPDAETRRALTNLIRVSRTHHRLFHTIHTFSPRQFIRPNVFQVSDDDQEAVDEAIWRGLYSTDILTLRSQDIMAKTNKFLTDAGLEEPFPSSPTRPARWGIRIDNTSTNQLWQWSNFYGIYAAKKWVQEIIADHKTNWIDDNTITVPALSIKITCEQKDGMTAIMDYEYTTQERQWEMPEPYATQILRIRNPGNYQQIVSERRADPASDDDRSHVKTRPERPSRPPRAQKSPKKRDDDLVSLPQLLDGTDISPKEARNILRRIAYPKPDAGWAFNPSDAPQVLKKIKDNRK